ncbi:MAG: hypothetical protein ACE5JX_13930 [Acidobacteriota bacterium]
MLALYLALGLSPGASGKQIRRRYLQLVKAFPAARHPGRFEKVTSAYEALKDRRGRVETAILGTLKSADFETALKELVEARPPGRRRPGFRELLEAEGVGDG